MTAKELDTATRMLWADFVTRKLPALYKSDAARVASGACKSFLSRTTFLLLLTFLRLQLKVNHMKDALFEDFLSKLFRVDKTIVALLSIMKGDFFNSCFDPLLFVGFIRCCCCCCFFAVFRVGCKDLQPLVSEEEVYSHPHVRKIYESCFFANFIL